MEGALGLLLVASAALVTLAVARHPSLRRPTTTATTTHPMTTNPRRANLPATSRPGRGGTPPARDCSTTASSTATAGRTPVLTPVGHYTAQCPQIRRARGTIGPVGPVPGFDPIDPIAPIAPI